MPRGRPDYDVWSAPVRYTPTQGLALYVIDFNIPKNTTQTSPKTANLVMEAGVVNRVNIIIPPGHAALAGLQIFNNTEQVIPVTSWIKGNDDNLIFDVDIQLTGSGSPPVYQLTLKGYNEDDTYDHTFYVRVWLMKGA
jgi:hypothetical protein